MIINKIVINNFGIYYGKNIFDFKTTEDQNIVLISGQNGSGKTTLLNAIKLSLYGPEFLGYQAYNDKYYSFIKTKLNAFALDKCLNDYFININFSLIESGVSTIYDVTRSWILKKDSITEKLNVKRNDKELNSQDSLNFFSYLHTFMPSSLYDMFFFDGEKIERMFFLKNGSKEINNTFNLLFNIDIFNILNNDLSKYIKQKNIYSTLSDNEKCYTTLLDKKNSLMNEKQEKEFNLQNMKDNLADNKALLKEAEKEFRILGGLNDKEINKYNENMHTLELEKEGTSSKLKEIINEYLPFLMVKNQLKEIVKSIDAENKMHENLIINSKLSDENFISQITSSLNIKNEDIKSVLKFITNYFNKDNNDKLLYNLSKDEEFTIKELNSKIINLDHNLIKSYQKKIDTYNKDSLALKKKLELNTNNQFVEKMKDIKIINSKIVSSEERIINLSSELENLNTELISLDTEINKIATKLKDAKKDENIFSVVEKIKKVINIYSTKIKTEKLKMLESEITNIFESLIRKEDFIKEIRIDSSNSDVKLINTLGKVMPESNLSAGEKQIYILSLLWGMLKISNRNVPLVFDTLLGRLDESHKENIVTKFIPTIGKQVIILSTDTEINDKYYKLLSKHISKHYSINFDSSTNTVKTIIG